MSSLALLIASLIALDNSETITITGPLVDIWCWDDNNKIALDTKSSLEVDPYDHTVHCMVEVSFCRESGFAFVHKPDGSSLYEIQYLLDTAGNQLAEDAMWAVPNTNRNDKVGFTFTITGTPDLTGSRPVLITASTNTTQHIPITTSHDAPITTTYHTTQDTADVIDVCDNGISATQTAGALIIEMILCFADDMIYIDVEYKDYNGNWFGIALGTGQMITDTALVWTTGLSTNTRDVGLYSYKITDRNGGAIMYEEAKDWTQEYMDINNGLRTVYKTQIANTMWTLSTEQISFGYAIGTSLSIQFHNDGYNGDFVMEFPSISTDDSKAHSLSCIAFTAIYTIYTYL